MLYAVSAVYFAGVMVRLMLTLTPVVCVLSAIAFPRLLEFYLKVQIFFLMVSNNCNFDLNKKKFIYKIVFRSAFLCGSKPDFDFSFSFIGFGY